MPRITTGWLNDSTTWTQQTLLLTIFDHGRANTILDTSSRIEDFHFRQHQGLYITGNPIQAYERGIPYCLEHRVIITHLTKWGFSCLLHCTISPPLFLAVPGHSAGTRFDGIQYSTWG